MAEEKLADSLYGNLYYNNGEVDNRANLSDPVAYRGSKLFSDAGPGNTAIVFIGADLRRSDNVRECVGQITGRIDDRFDVGHQGTAAAGSWEVFCRAPNAGSVDNAMRKVLTLTHDSATFHVPVNASPSAPVVAGGNEFHHPLGVVWFVIQEDGNFVIYQNKVQYVPDTNHPIYWTGSQITPGYTEMRPNHVPPPPVPPSTPNPTPEVDTSVHFNYLGTNYDVHAGDFDAMTHIFKVLLDASDITAYHNGNLSWEGVLAKYLRKVDGDNVSR